MTTDTVAPARTASRPDIARLMRPASVAIVGASSNPGASGRRVLANLERFTFGGDIHLVSRSGEDIAGRPSVSAIGELPRGIDLAVLAIPGAGIRDAVEACVERGIGAAVVYSSGFAEMGEDGQRLQQEIADIAKAGNLALLGPNCIGMTNFVDGTPLSFGVQRPAAITWPAVAIIGQSGGMVGNIRLSCAARKLPVSYTISTGNEAVLTINDFIAHVIEDEPTRVISVFAEQIRDPQRFLALAAKARARGKQIVLIHPGQSEAARDAAQSHTGSMATNHAVMSTLVREAGVILVDTIDEMTDTIELVARTPGWDARGPAILTESGAFKGLALDMCARLGITLPNLEEATAATLKTILPAFAHVSNPLDVTAQGLQQPDIYGHSAAALIADENIGAVALVLMPGPPEFGLKVVDLTLPLVANTDKPVIYVLLGDSSPIADEIPQRLREAGIAFFRSPDRALRAMAGVAAAAAASTEQASAGGPVLTLPETRGILPEYRGKALLRDAGFAVPEGGLAKTAEEAVAIAAQLGGPVAMKAQAAQLSHKSDIGAVSLNLTEPEDIRRHFAQQQDNIAAAMPGLEPDGLLVERMQAKGQEFFIAARRDEEWGPVLMVGLGGVWIEVLNDIAMLGAANGREQVLAAIRSLKGFELINGYRGQEPVDVDAIVDAVLSLGALIRANPRIVEAEINPLAVGPNGSRAVALDALVTLA